MLLLLFQRRLYKTVTEIPENLKEVMDQETFTKARLYNLDKSNFGFWVGLWGEIESSVSFAIAFPSMSREIEYGIKNIIFVILTS